MTEIEQYERIEAYLADTLSEAERRDFEARLRSDAQLQAQVRLHDRLQRTLGGDDLTQLQQKLQHIMHTPVPVQPLYRRWWPYWAAAASVLLLAVLWLWPNPSHTHGLFYTYAEPYPQVGDMAPGRGMRSTEPGAAPKVAPAPEAFFQAYERKDFDQALAHLQGWAESHPEAGADSASPYPYYRGITLMQLERYAEASEALAQVQGGNFAEAAAWWRALCRLKVEGNTEAVRAALREIAEDRQPRSEAAREVLQKLER